MAKKIWLKESFDDSGLNLITTWLNDLEEDYSYVDASSLNITHFTNRYGKSYFLVVIRVDTYDYSDNSSKWEYTVTYPNQTLDKTKER